MDFCFTVNFKLRVRKIYVDESKINGIKFFKKACIKDCFMNT